MKTSFVFFLLFIAQSLLPVGLSGFYSSHDSVSLEHSADQSQQSLVAGNGLNSNTSFVAPDELVPEDTLDYIVDSPSHLQSIFSGEKNTILYTAQPVFDFRNFLLIYLSRFSTSPPQAILA